MTDPETPDFLRKQATGRATSPRYAPPGLVLGAAGLLGWAIARPATTWRDVLKISAPSRSPNAWCAIANCISGGGVTVVSILGSRWPPASPARKSRCRSSSCWSTILSHPSILAVREGRRRARGLLWRERLVPMLESRRKANPRPPPGCDDAGVASHFGEHCAAAAASVAGGAHLQLRVHVLRRVRRHGSRQRLPHCGGGSPQADTAGVQLEQQRQLVSGPGRYDDQASPGRSGDSRAAEIVATIAPQALDFLPSFVEMSPFLRRREGHESREEASAPPSAITPTPPHAIAWRGEPNFTQRAVALSGGDICRRLCRTSGAARSRGRDRSRATKRRRRDSRWYGWRRHQTPAQPAWRR